MAVVAVLAGVWFVLMGWWVFAHPEGFPGTPAAGWLSFPSGRRFGGAVSMLLGAAVVVGALTL